MIVSKLYQIDNVNISLPVAIIVGIAIGVAAGALNGFLVTVVKINSIIATLGTLFIFRGLNYIYANIPSRIYDEKFLFLGRGFLFGHIPITLIYFIIIFLLQLIVKSNKRKTSDINRRFISENHALKNETVSTSTFIKPVFN